MQSPSSPSGPSRRHPQPSANANGHAGPQSPHADMIDFLNTPPPNAPTSSDGLDPGVSGDANGGTGPGTAKRPMFGMKKRVSPAGKPAGWRGPGRPDPWILRKFMVIVLLALFVWSFYVVVGRICAPMIQGRSATGLGKGAGAGLLVGFVIVWFMCVWTYLKISLTGPGFARNYVPKAPPPPKAAPPNYHPMNGQEFPLPASQYASMPPPSHNDDGAGPDPSTFAPIINLGVQARDAVADMQEPRESTNERFSSATLMPMIPNDTAEPSKPFQIGQGAKSGKRKGTADWRELRRPTPRIPIGPRWCQYCEINKPDRAHHCRHCGQCVLAFDHHCLWIGQCVGWQNHKFFMNFNFWGFFFNLYTLATCIAYSAKLPEQDGQVIGIIVIAAMFTLFNAMMYGSHVHLFLTGRTTIESFGGRDQVEEENRILQLEYGILWHNQEKRRVKRRWKAEYGGVSVDERWRSGTKRELWQIRMGRSWIEWLLPIGRSRGDGVHFDQNPHFGPNGEWLMVKDWPKELQPRSSLSINTALSEV